MHFYRNTSLESEFRTRKLYRCYRSGDFTVKFLAIPWSFLERIIWSPYIFLWFKIKENTRSFTLSHKLNFASVAAALTWKKQWLSHSEKCHNVANELDKWNSSFTGPKYIVTSWEPLTHIEASRQNMRCKPVFYLEMKDSFPDCHLPMQLCLPFVGEVWKCRWYLVQC